MCFALPSEMTIPFGGLPSPLVPRAVIATAPGAKAMVTVSALTATVSTSPTAARWMPTFVRDEAGHIFKFGGHVDGMTKCGVSVELVESRQQGRSEKPVTSVGRAERARDQRATHAEGGYGDESLHFIPVLCTEPQDLLRVCFLARELVVHVMPQRQLPNSASNAAIASSMEA
jgi:hypothetical protein